MWNYNHWTGKTGRSLLGDKPPENHILLYFWVWKEHFWSLMKLNLYVILHALPIVTLFPALAAMNRVIYNMIEDKPQLLWIEYRDVFRKECKAALIAEIPAMLFCTVFILIGGFFRNATVSGGHVVVAFLGLAIVFLVSSYLLGMLPYVQISVKQCYKNAILMLGLCFVRNLFLLLVVILLAMLFVLGHPLTTPVLLFFAVPVFGYFIAFQTYIPIHKYLVNVQEKSE